MRMQMGLQTRQIQTQKLAPRMIQSMEILQLPTLALQERIEQEMNENPLLEQQEIDPTVPEEEIEAPSQDTRSESEKELVVDGDSDNSEDFERLQNMVAELPSTFDDSFKRSANRVQQDSDRRHDLMANAQARPESLNDFLQHQLSEMDIDDRVEHFAERIISTLDARDGGYLRTPLADLLPAGHSEEDAELAEQALEIVQSLEPLGIAARTLSECLVRQLKPDFPHFDEMKTLVTSHLTDLAENRLPQIAKQAGYTIELIQKVRAELHVLNPKPGAAFMETYVPNVTPDIILEQDDEGEYKVRLDDDRVPTLFISEYYRKRLMDPSSTCLLYTSPSPRDRG